jgi:retinol dehydrogenase 12
MSRDNTRTAVVTGATSGIGREVALILAGQGARVIGVGRNAERCRRAEEEIRAACGQADVQFLAADLSSLSAVRRLGQDLLARVPRLDTLVNNAGTFTTGRCLTVDGLETQIAVNWLSAFLLTSLLLPALRRSADGRVVNLSSASHYAGTMHWDDLGLAKRWFGLAAYDQSKLAMVLFTAELARRCPLPVGPAAYAVDPGLVRTEIGAKGTGALASLVWKVRTRGGISPRQAADSVAWCAAEAGARGRTGLYWKEKAAVPPSEQARDPRAARLLWEIGERLSGLAPREAWYDGDSLHAAEA